MPTTSETTYASTTDTTALTITIASLASSSTLVAGRQSAVVDNTTNKYLDVEVFGQITTGTSPTPAGSHILVYAFAPIKIVSSTKTYPVAGTTALGASDAAATFDAAQLIVLPVIASIGINTTSDRKYSFHVGSLAQVFGGMPPFWGVFVVHNTGVNLNSTAGNHWIHYLGHNVTAS